MIKPAIIVAAFALLPSSYEQGDVQAVSKEIAAVAANRVEAATLMALAYHETKLSKLVMEGHCDQLPKGMQCDGGKALGVWQLHKEACPAAWALATPNGGPEGQRESLHEQARCAIRLLRWNAKRGKGAAPSELRAAFAGYAARPWDWEGAEVREKTVERLLRKWPRKSAAF
jgi:hypothetical protein